MSPLSFLSRPAVWAEVITRTRATHTAAPHFGYALLLRKTTSEQRVQFDFSHLRVLMSAGEPIHAETMDRFLTAFAASALRRQAWCPAYGLAEHTVGVTMSGRKILHADRARLEKHGEYRVAAKEAPAGAVAMLVSCGTAEPDVSVRIVDPDRCHALPDGIVGEIWVDSPSKASAYFGRPEETTATLRAQLAGCQSQRGYLRTGDLGFLHDGELFVTGRLKDLIIVAGRNVAAIDIEEAVRAASPQVRPGGIAAVAVTDARGDTEAVGLVLEAASSKIDATAARAIAEIACSAVRAHLQVLVAVVVIGAPGLVPKTTSGKPQRSSCRDALHGGALAQRPEFRYRFDFDFLSTAESPLASASSEPRASFQGLPARLHALPVEDRLDALIAALQEAVARALGRNDAHQFDPRAPLSAFGMDSIILVEFADELAALLDAPLTLALVAALPNLTSLAAYLLNEVLNLDFVEAAPRADKAGPLRSRLHTPTWRPALVSRIAIVGAGCAGLVAAMELAQRGYHDVTIFESQPQVGGKVYTASHAGVDFEMGQLLFGQRYGAIWRLAVDIGCALVSEPGTDFMEDESGERVEMRTTHAIKTWYQSLFAAAALDPRAPPEASVEDTPEDLLLPVGAWLEKKRLARLPAAFLTSWTGCGYGYLSDQVPAWYLLRYAQIIHSATVLPLALKGGNRSHWERAARVLSERHRFDIRIGATVTRYEADAGGVSLAVANAAPERFDAVLFTLPPHALAPLLPMAARDPFMRFHHYGYRIAAFEATGMPERARSIQFAEAQRVHEPGQVLGVVRAHAAPRGFIAGQYVSRPGEAALSDGELDERLEVRLKRLGLQTTGRHGNAC